jgi:nucleoside-diphosphate-sugar epimerase
VGYAFLNGEVLIKSDGTPWRPLVHIEDISRAFLATLEAPCELIHNVAYNVGRSSENYQVRDVAEHVERIVPESKITYAEGGGADTRCYRVDFSKIETKLPGYDPQWTVPRGIEELLAAYRANNLRIEDFEGRTFIRLKTLKSHMACGDLDADLFWTSNAAAPG